MRGQVDQVPAVALSIVLPVRRGGEPFRRCIAALLEASRVGGLPGDEIIVVADDGHDPGDDSWRVAEEAGLRCVRLEGRHGPAVARNRGAAEATGDVLFFVDADVVVPDDILIEVRKLFVDDPGLGAFIGSYDDDPAHPGFFSQYKNLQHHYVHQKSRTQASTFWGACGAIRRETFDAAGGFDERFRRPSVEDIELGYRLRRANVRIELKKHIQVKHLKRWTFRSILVTDFLLRAVPWTMLILRDAHFPDELNIRLRERVSVAGAYTALGAAVGALVAGWLALVALVAAASVVAVNLGTYRFFYRKRGAWFALRSVPMHALYLLYAGAGFAVGAIAWLFAGRGPTGRLPPVFRTPSAPVPRVEA